MKWRRPRETENWIQSDLLFLVSPSLARQTHRDHFVRRRRRRHPSSVAVSASSVVVTLSCPEHNFSIAAAQILYTDSYSSGKVRCIRTVTPDAVFLELFPFAVFYCQKHNINTITGM